MEMKNKKIALDKVKDQYRHIRDKIQEEENAQLKKNLKKFDSYQKEKDKAQGKDGDDPNLPIETRFNNL